jgi:hypothetical protein
VTPAQAAPSSNHPAHATRDHLMVYRVNEGVASGIESTSAEDAAYRQQAEDFLATVIQSRQPKSTIKDENHVPLPSDQELAAVLSDLEAADTGSAPLKKSTTYEKSTAAATVHVTAAAASDPTAGWPIKGAVTDSSGLNWKMQEYNEADYCNVSGCTVYDRIRSSISINTGPTTARVTHQTLWSPKHGELNSPHFDLYAVCSGTGCGSIAPTHNIRTDLQNETFYLDHTTVWGKVVTIGVNLRSVNSSGGHLGDPGKTHDFKCPTQASGNTACKSY